MRDLQDILEFASGDRALAVKSFDKDHRERGLTAADANCPPRMLSLVG